MVQDNAWQYIPENYYLLVEFSLSFGGFSLFFVWRMRVFFCRSVPETKAKLAQMYDGYHFAHDVEGVYNPFCLLKCLKNKDFGSYWFESGTPSFLVKTLQNQPLFLAGLVNGRNAKEDQFKNYDPDSKNMLPVVYQSGYLTIKGFEKERRIYRLDFPNQEIKDGFLDVLLKKFVTVPDDDMGLAIDNLSDALNVHDVDKRHSHNR